MRPTLKQRQAMGNWAGRTFVNRAGKYQGQAITVARPAVKNMARWVVRAPDGAEWEIDFYFLADRLGVKLYGL